MKKIIIILFVFIPFVTLAAEDWKNENIDGYNFSWRFIEENIEVELSYPVEGWIAIGFDAENKMAGANIIMGAVKDGELLIEDHFGNGIFRHSQDVKIGGTTDIVNAEGSESNGLTTLKFTIPADSGDEKDKTLEEGKLYRIIFASSSTDNIGRKHNNRTGADIRL